MELGLVQILWRLMPIKGKGAIPRSPKTVAEVGPPVLDCFAGAVTRLGYC